MKELSEKVKETVDEYVAKMVNDGTLVVYRQVAHIAIIADREERDKETYWNHYYTSIHLVFAWYDFWVGAFWDAKKRRLYIFPVPMLGLYVQFRHRITER